MGLNFPAGGDTNDGGSDIGGRFSVTTRAPSFAVAEGRALFDGEAIGGITNAFEEPNVGAAVPVAASPHSDCRDAIRSPVG